MSRKAIVFCLVLAGALVNLWGETPPASQGTDPDTRRLVETFVKRFYDQQNLGGRSGNILENVFVRQHITVVDEKTESSTVLMFFKEPEVGIAYMVDRTGRPTAFLLRGDSSWIFREGLRLPLKITLSHDVVGEANLGDIVGLNLRDDFRITGVREEGDSIIFSYERTDPRYPYPFVDVIANRESRDLTSILYKSMSGRVIREALLSDYSTLRGNHRFPVWTIVNRQINTNRRTILRYQEVRRIAVPEAFFQPNATSLSQFLIWARGFK